LNQFAVITPVPEMIEAFIKNSILKKILDRTVLEIKIFNLRDYGIGKHKQIDDAPYGGGGGMILKPEPLFRAIDAAMSWIKIKESTRVIFTSPGSQKWDQSLAEKFSKIKNIIILCGHYKGIDERVIDEFVTDQFSVGDYVLTCGEIPALIMIDSVARLIPGALNNQNSAFKDSFSYNLLDHPHYTNPRKYRNRSVPEILLNGNHKKIDKWRLKFRKSRTIAHRSDLWEKFTKVKESEIKNG
tara:strand:+ start:5442 stop:6167 length:726 start_codon:yes stop_codon:yes gene_type:complete